jgi:hypothetical protein
VSASISFRPGVVTDHPFAFESFMRSMRGSAHAEGADFHAVSLHFIGLLTSWKLLIACTADDPDTILGWCLYRDPHTVAHVLVHKLHRQWLKPEVLLHAAGISSELALVFPNSRHHLTGYSPVFRPWIGVNG